LVQKRTRFARQQQLLPVVYQMASLQLSLLCIAWVSWATTSLRMMLLWTASAAFFGMFFAVPLRSHFVINQDLVFSTPRAAAETIKNLHRAGSGCSQLGQDHDRLLCHSHDLSIIGFFIPGIWNHPYPVLHRQGCQLHQHDGRQVGLGLQLGFRLL